MLQRVIVFSDAPPPAVPLVGQIFTCENAQAHLANTDVK
jgi:hypothetical protein